MNIIGKLVDDQYKKSETYRKRLIVRALVRRDDGLFAIHKIYRHDAFGEHTYFETPGGGVQDHETKEEALLRECEEELGYKVEIIEELGIVEDFYNLLGWHNINCYYYCRQLGYVGKNLVSDGDFLIQDTLYLPLEEIISLYQSTKDEGISLLLKRRELPLWMMMRNKSLSY